MSNDNQNEDLVDYPPQVIGILNRIREAHSLLSVRLENASQLYSSAIIEVKPDEQLILMDELYPRSGHDKVRPGSLLSVRTRLKGVDTQFDIEIKSVENVGDVASYLAVIPAEIYYYQRRQQYRAPVELNSQLSVSVAPHPDTTITGQVFDVSLNGLGIHFDTTAGQLLEKNQLLRDVTIRFPDCTPFITSLEVRSIRLNKTGNLLIVGTQFSNLSQRDERQVQRFVMALDRNSRQNRR